MTKTEKIGGVAGGISIENIVDVKDVARATNIEGEELDDLVYQARMMMNQ